MISVGPVWGRRSIGTGLSKFLILCHHQFVSTEGVGATAGMTGICPKSPLYATLSCFIFNRFQIQTGENTFLESYHMPLSSFFNNYIQILQTVFFQNFLYDRWVEFSLFLGCAMVIWVFWVSMGWKDENCKWSSVAIGSPTRKKAHGF